MRTGKKHLYRLVTPVATQQLYMRCSAQHKDYFLLIQETEMWPCCQQAATGMPGAHGRSQVANAGMTGGCTGRLETSTQSMSYPKHCGNAQTKGLNLERENWLLSPYCLHVKVRDMVSTGKLSCHVIRHIALYSASIENSSYRAFAQTQFVA